MKGLSSFGRFRQSVPCSVRAGELHRPEDLHNGTARSALIPITRHINKIAPQHK